MLIGLFLAAATQAAPPPAPRAVAVARARIVSAARISFSAAAPKGRKGKPGLIEFQ